MLDRLMRRWQGVVLALITVIATLSLALSGKLGLYIHPRYFVFTVVMTLIGAVLVVSAFAIVPGTDPEHEHDDANHDGHDEEQDSHQAPPRAGGWGVAVGAIVLVGATVALLVLPPETLTAATAAQRSVNSSTANLRANAPTLTGADTSTFTVKDWALLLAQNSTPSFYSAKKVHVIGFVSPAPDDPDNTFYIARFVVTCCAVDAQPVGVPVHSPGWAAHWSPGDWVEATGTFAATAGSSAIMLQPTQLNKAAKPDQPYVF